MISRIGFVLCLICCFVLAAALIGNWRSQHDTQQQIAELKKEIDHQKTSEPAVASTGTASAASGPVIIQQAPLPTAAAQQHQQVLQVMDAGWKLINQRNVIAGQQAADLFQAAIEKIDSRSADLYNGLGRALLVAGKPREAIVAWRHGLDLQPKFAEMQSGIGWGYWHLGNPYFAKKAWDAAVVLDPKCADAWAALAWIDLALGDKQTAKRGFQELVAFQNSNRAWIMGLSMAQAGNSNVEQIAQFFRLPALESFTTPVPDPVESVATAAAP